MTPADIEAAARRKYNVVGDTFFTTDFFYDLIFEAECDLATETQLIEKVYSTVSVDGQREYSWPTNAISIRRLEYDGNKMKKTNFREDDALTLSQSDTLQKGVPEFYQLWDRTIYLRPIPGDDDKTIKIYSYDMPERQSTPGGILDTPIVFHPDIVNYCVYGLATKQQDESAANLYLSKWSAAVTKARRWHQKRKRADNFARVQNVDDLPSTTFGVI